MCSRGCSRAVTCGHSSHQSPSLSCQADTLPPSTSLASYTVGWCPAPAAHRIRCVTYVLFVFLVVLAFPGGLVPFANGSSDPVSHPLYDLFFHRFWPSPWGWVDALRRRVTGSGVHSLYCLFFLKYAAKHKEFLPDV